jgi:caa(3)-type oxidase subunit IV
VTGMDAQVATQPHHESGAAGYIRIALVLFVLTALEVLAFEVSRRPGWPLHEIIRPMLDETLIVLSAIKFALVAMFYMHLKQDSRIFSGLLIFPLIIAAVVILALLGLFTYLRLLHPTA